MAYSYTHLLVEVDEDGVALCTLNRPEVLNAVNGVLHSELEDLFVRLGKDRDVKAAVLTGAGRAFCAGGDIRDMRGSADDRPAGYFDSGARELIFSLLSLEKPIIAAVNGDAVGLGATIALGCDVVFMSETARIGDTHVRVGLVPGDGGAVLWPLLVGPARAKELLMTGDLLPAPEAYRMGLVAHVLPPEQVLPEAMALARRLARGPGLAIRFAKLSVQRLILQSYFQVLDLSLALETITGKSQDHQEAVRAFMEKRQPRFQGR
ncbi:MAG TPA: enoyl-CoA hydratase-related protein [Dehalococcoidia bacterium]|nr:enoyl-CoA hydratase-related protein [Dehalococcoidia bacterium]